MAEVVFSSLNSLIMDQIPTVWSRALANFLMNLEKDHTCYISIMKEVIEG